MLTNFNPVEFTNAENEWLIEHLGEAPVVAMKTIRGTTSPTAHPKDKNPIIYPDGVVPSSVRPVIEGVYELMELEKAEGLKWIGIDRMKETIRVWQRENAKWLSDHQRSGKRIPRWPSLFAWDAKGKGHLGGPGSDSGKVKTWFGKAGERIPFAIDLLIQAPFEWRAPNEEPKVTVGLSVDAEAHRIECRVKMDDGTVCGHTESYKQDSRKSYNMARGRMSKHLRKATQEVEAHRELQTLEFGQ